MAWKKLFWILNEQIILNWSKLSNEKREEDVSNVKSGNNRSSIDCFTVYGLSKNIDSYKNFKVYHNSVWQLRKGS